MSMVFRNADDVDFFESNHPVNPHECEPMVELLRDSLWRLAWVDPGQGKPLKTLTRIGVYPVPVIVVPFNFLVGGSR